MEKETVTIPKERLSTMIESLREIKEITKGMTTFNHTYDIIHKLACKGLDIKEE